MAITVKQAMTKMREDLLNAYQGSAGNATAQIVDETPKDYGSASASWTAAKNRMEANNIDIDEGDSNRNNNAEIIRLLKISDKYILANAQPYIELLEAGFSSQNSHMVQRTIAAWQEHVDAAVREARRS